MRYPIMIRKINKFDSTKNRFGLGLIVLLMFSIVACSATNSSDGDDAEVAQVIAQPEQIEETASAAPTASETPTPQPTDTETPTATTVPTDPPTATATPNPVDTAASNSEEPTPVPTAVVPTATPTQPPPTDTPTVEPTATPTIPPPTPTPEPVAISPASFQLVEPGHTSNITQDISTFVWRWDGPALAENQAFEVRIWKDGEPHYGAFDARKTSSFMTQQAGGFALSFTVSSAFSVQQNGNSDYLWSVAVVQLEPYQLVVESNPRPVIINVAGGSQGGDDGHSYH